MSHSRDAAQHVDPPTLHGSDTFMLGPFALMTHTDSSPAVMTINSDLSSGVLEPTEPKALTVIEVFVCGLWTK